MNARTACLLLATALGTTGSLRALAPPAERLPAPPTGAAGAPPAALKDLKLAAPAASPCGDPCGGPCVLDCVPGDCATACAARRGALELQADFLMWWTKSTPTPPLVSTSSPADLGVLGTPTGIPVIGGQGISTHPQYGGRLAARYVTSNGLGVEVGGFFLENGTNDLSAAGLPVVAVPLNDPATGANYAIRLAAPDAAAGSAAVSVNHRLWGLDASGVRRIQSGGAVDLDLLAGFRFLQQAEALSLVTTTTPFTPAFFAGAVAPEGSTLATADSFTTRNNFYGGQLAARARGTWRAVSLQATVGVALGTIEQTVNINGATALQAPGAASVTVPGGILAQSTNIGRFQRNEFGVIPQGSLAAGVQVTDRLRALVGYDFLYINNVVRPGDQIDRTVNPNLPPLINFGNVGGAARPAPRFTTTDYWAQGLSFGVELAF